MAIEPVVDATVPAISGATISGLLAMCVSLTRRICLGVLP